jgi:hypothetical protein
LGSRGGERQGQQGSGGDKRQLNKVQEEVRGKVKVQEEVEAWSTRFRRR